MAFQKGKKRWIFPGYTAWTGKENATAIEAVIFPWETDLSHSPLGLFSSCQYLLTLINHECRESHLEGNLSSPYSLKTNHV